MLSDLLPNKNLDVNALRSIYISYWVPKLNKNEIIRVAFLMRSSVNMLTTNYLKKNDDNQTTTKQSTQPRAEIEEEKEIKIDKLRDRRAYLKAYYETNKEKIIDSIKKTDKAGYDKRFLRELNDGVITWEKVRASTRAKYKLSYDVNKKIYVSDL